MLIAEMMDLKDSRFFKTSISKLALLLEIDKQVKRSVLHLKYTTDKPKLSNWIMYVYATDRSVAWQTSIK